MVCSVFERISGSVLSSDAIAPRCLKLNTVPSFCLFTLISLLMPLAFFCHQFDLLSTDFQLIYNLCRYCQDFQPGLLAPADPELEYLCQRQPANW